MPYFLVSDFRGGLDTRKAPWTAEAGTLQVFVNGHVTRGGEIEKRKEFTDSGDLLAATYALVAASTGASARGLVVFGSDAAPVGLPAGVTYQRLQHPDGTPVLTGIDALTLYDGKPYAVARFDDNSQWHFYDGELVTDWGAGVVRASMTTNDDIAEHLRTLIDADADYTATRIADQITVVGPIGVDYHAEGETENADGGVDDQTIGVVELEEAIPEVAAAPSAAEFAILGGSDDAGVNNYVEKVRVDISGVFTELLSASVPFNTSPELTAADVTAAINAGTGTHGYTAQTQYGKVFVYADPALGESADGYVLEVRAKGDVILYNGGFSISDGTASAGVNKVTSVKANGLEILGASVDWTTSNAATASAVATQIRAYASSPKYNAYADGETVFVSPSIIRSSDPTTTSLVATSAGDVAFESGSAPQVVEQYPDYDDIGKCVAVESFLPSGGTAGEVVVGDELELAEAETLAPRTGVVSYSDRGMQKCYRIVTVGGASLVCSDSAPIPVQAGGYRQPAHLMGHKVAVRRADSIGWESVADIVSVGFRAVQNITVENACFWAGEQDGVYILHHNLKNNDF